MPLRLLLGQVSPHERIQFLFKAGKMALAAYDLGDLKDHFFNIGVVKQQHGRPELIGPVGHFLGEFGKIGGLHQQAGNSLLHQRQKGLCHQLPVPTGISKRGDHQVAPVKIRQLHARGVVFKEHGLRHCPLEPFLPRNHAQVANLLKPEQLPDVNQVSHSFAPFPPSFSAHMLFILPLVRLVCNI